MTILDLERRGGRDMKDVTITDSILYVGVDDKTLDLFESQYIIPNGVSYNSYVILDEKVAVMDTVDKNFFNEWMQNIKNELGDTSPDYLIVQHMEPDHSANIHNFIKEYPNTKIVASAKAFAAASTSLWVLAFLAALASESSSTIAAQLSFV